MDLNLPRRSGRGHKSIARPHRADPPERPGRLQQHTMPVRARRVDGGLDEAFLHRQPPRLHDLYTATRFKAATCGGASQGAPARFLG